LSRGFSNNITVQLISDHCKCLYLRAHKSIYVYIYKDICWPKQILFWPCFGAHTNTQCRQCPGREMILILIFRQLQYKCDHFKTKWRPQQRGNNKHILMYDMIWIKFLQPPRWGHPPPSTPMTPFPLANPLTPFTSNEMIWNRFVVFTSCKSF